jgi:Domain of unknown function (DUF4258)
MPTYSDHARQAMALRRVTEADVEQVLYAPHGAPLVEPGHGDPPTLVVTGFDAEARLLKVVVSEADMDHIVTVVR